LTIQFSQIGSNASANLKYFKNMGSYTLTCAYTGTWQQNFWESFKTG